MRESLQTGSEPSPRQLTRSDTMSVLSLIVKDPSLLCEKRFLKEPEGVESRSHGTHGSQLRRS
jgi:hypothetical protein